MRYVVADTLLQSIERLDRSEQPLVKSKVFDFQTSPAAPGKGYHRIDRAAQDGYWSFRVNRDLRLVVFEDGDVRVLCYAGHHDDAYAWAARHVLEQHPATGAMQLVRLEREVRHEVRHEVRVVEEEPPVLARHEPEYLLALGVPPAWMDAVRSATQDALLQIAAELPEDVAERILDLAVGNPVPRPALTPHGDRWRNPDARRHFHLVDDQQALRQALDYPWQRWIVFLHPSQREAVEAAQAGPTLVTGGAGTGKTVVALHRARHLALLHNDARVLLTTFSRTLALSLERNAARLMGDDNALLQRVRVVHLHRLADEIWSRHRRGGFTPAPAERVRAGLARARAALGLEDIDLAFLEGEWNHLIDPWQVRDWNTYRSLSRSGRGVPLGARQRRRLWPAFEAVWSELRSAGLTTWSQLASEAAHMVVEHPQERFDHVVADECQDFGPSELRLLRALAPEGPNDLTLTGDAGQRIYQPRFAWSAAGIHLRGRARTLRVNYRTTEQIRRFADRMRQDEAGDDEPLAAGRPAISLLHGPRPDICRCRTIAEEIERVGQWMADRLAEGYRPEDLAVFARTRSVLSERGRAAVEAAGAVALELREDQEPTPGHVSLATMHRAKGLEFRAVAAVGCEARFVPLRAHLRTVTETADREAFLARERHLLYVACTRARERLLVTCCGAPSPFLPAVPAGPDGD